MERESFVFYRSFYNSLKNLSLEDRDELSMAMYEYALNGVEPELDGYLLSMFDLIRPQIDANNKRYVDGCKGGRPPKTWDNSQKPLDNHSVTKQKPLDNQTITKPEPNDNDNVNDNVNVNDNENEKGCGEKHTELDAKASRGAVAKKNVKSKKKQYDVDSLIHTDNETEEERDKMNEVRIEFKEMRKKIKKPLTDYAEYLRAKDLNNFSSIPRDRIKIVERSIAHCRQDLYDLPEEEKTKEETKVVNINGINYFI